MVFNKQLDAAAKQGLMLHYECTAHLLANLPMKGCRRIRDSTASCYTSGPDRVESFGPPTAVVCWPGWVAYYAVLYAMVCCFCQLFPGNRVQVLKHAGNPCNSTVMQAACWFSSCLLTDLVQLCSLEPIGFDWLFLQKAKSRQLHSRPAQRGYL
jgi:hypothetical protein